MSQNLFATLRIAAIERNHKGSPESRDKCIEMYLEELGTLLSEKILQAIPTETLTSGYEGWLRLTLSGMDKEGRLAAMAKAVTFFPSLMTGDPTNQETFTGNVVSLFN